VLLRPGTIARAEIEAITGPLASPSLPDAEDAPRAAPGMIARHYAPRATVHLVTRDGLEDALVALRGSPAAAHTAVVSWSVPRTITDVAVHHRLPSDADGYAARLYDTLHAVDEIGCTAVLVELPPDDARWDGVRDRLTRAAHP
jgi:L-threonylcarbamoyladenylate synthase